MELSVIIVNWNSKEFLRKCLASVLAGTRDLEFEIIVIDSASFDGCGRMLQDEFPGVRFIQSEENLGFGRSNNRAFEQAKGEFVLFLNPDTEVVGGAINTLLEALKTLPGAGAVGARLLNTDGSLQTTCVQAFPTILNQLLGIEALRRRFPRLGLWGASPLFSGENAAAEIDVISGACLMTRRELFARVGMFNPDYFTYSEDVELCLRFRQAGTRSYYVPSAAVVHHGGGSSARSQYSAFASVMFMESRWKFFRRTRPAWYCWLFRAAVLVVSLVRVVASMVLWPLALLITRGGQWKAVTRKWLARLRWTLGLERWARNYGT